MEYWFVTLQDLFYLRASLDLAHLSLTRTVDAHPSGSDPQKACVLGAVMCSVSFLECSINGLYEYARSPVRGTKLHQALASVWNEGFDRQPMLAKYQIALALARREPFRTGSDPYQSTAALLDLRNAIAHPKELQESEAQQRKLETRLKGRYFFNPKQEHRREFFPERCLSCDCSFWAVEIAASFFLEFQRRMPRRAYFFVAERAIEALLKETRTARLQRKPVSHHTL
jgi:hypothetical protein